MTNIPFGIMSYKSDSLPLSAQSCVNMFLEAQPKGTKTITPIFGVPGITEFSTLGTGPVRGLHNMDGTAYGVGGARLYSIDSGGTSVDLGGNISGTSNVYMADNGTELVIVNGTFGYIYDVASGFRIISDADFKAANSVGFIDSFFILDEAGTGRIYRSQSLDGTAYDALDFATAEMESDDVVAVYPHKDLLYVFGGRTTELWRNAGAANFPFVRLRGSSLKRGLASTNAITDDDESVFFLGNDRIAYRLQGNRLIRISTHALEREWEGYSSVSDVICNSYTFGGHKFINYTFPTGNKTFSYDVSTKVWHQRVSHDRTGISLGRWRVNAIEEAYQKTLVGDAFSGKVGFIDKTVFTEFGDRILAEVVSPSLHGNGQRVSMPWFELDVDTGEGLTTGQGSDPQVMLSISDDGGRSFDNAEIWRSAGKLGEYDGTIYQLRWDRLGRFHERYIKITMSDPVRRTIKGARAPGIKVA